MIDSMLLVSMRLRGTYSRLIGKVPEDLVSGDTVGMLKWYGAFFRAFPDSDHVDYEAFVEFIRIRLIKIPDKMELMLSLWKEINREPTYYLYPAQLETLIEDVWLAGKAGMIAAQYQAGEEVDLKAELTAALNEHNSEGGVDAFDSTPITDILNEFSEEGGFAFRFCGMLRDNLYPVTPGNLIMVAARVNQGKCLAKGTLVTMADGSQVKVEDIQVGQVLAGPFRNNKVTSLAKGYSEMYKVSYNNGESYTVNSDHILSLKRSSTEGPYTTGDILNVPVKEYIKWPQGRKDRYKGWFSGITLPNKPLSMDPYILGVWLGDGTTSKPSVTSMHWEVVEKVIGYYGLPSASRSKSKATTYYWYGTAMLDDLRRINVLGNKHIPEEYLIAGDSQRAELLSGLIDTDGYATPYGVELVTKYPEMANQIVRLARSLGIFTNKSEVFKRAVGTSHKGDWYYKILMGVEVYSQCNLRRKKHQESALKVKGGHRGLVRRIDVTPVGVGEYFGFTLDGDHLFLLGDFTVTHNTSLLCRILADWSQQVEKVYGCKRPIMYLNNESAVSRIKGRLYQAALKATIPELQSVGDAEDLDHAFKLATNNCEFLFKDIHGWDVSKVESLVKQYEPGILMIDMPANIKLSGKFHNTVDAVEHIWQSMREWSVLYNTVVIGTAQISIEGDDMLFPPLSSVKDSKGAVQGALDLQINMGYVSSIPGLRGLGVVKSKRIRPGVGVMQAEVWFNNDNCTFNDGE